MNARKIEPGLLRVFRWYAGLRIALLLLFGLLPYYFVPDNRLGLHQEIDFLPYALVVIISMAFLLGYLSWPWLQQKLKRAYLPLAVFLATTGLILDQYLLSPSARIWQPDPFLFILLILIAWQYDVRAVLLFALGTASFELALNALIPQPNLDVLRMGPFSQNSVQISRVVARTISFIILGFVIVSLMRSQREQRRALAEANQKLVQNAATLEQLTITRERNRLSRELHDTLAHTLSALSVQLDAVTTVWKDIPGKARKMLAKMLKTTRSGLDDTRRAIHDLRASRLEDIGLFLALQEMAQDFAARNSLDLVLDVSDGLDNLPPEVEQGVYRVAQEALENITRHANAQHLWFSLVEENKHIQLTIEDDGQGFDEQRRPAENQLGLMGMRERAEMIGGSFELGSQPGQGTVVRLRVELNQ